MIREATLRDIPRLQVIRAAVRENVLSNPGLVTLADYEAHIVGHGRTWVAEVEGEIVGFSSADGERATIWALFVDPVHEARGHGRRLLAPAVAWLWARGAAQVGLSTGPGTRAEGFYRAAGWTNTGMAGPELVFVLPRPPG
nr:GNAT family N-acetyltransferase [Nannocystis sp.]